MIYTPRPDKNNGTMYDISVWGSNKPDGDFVELAKNVKRELNDGNTIVPLDTKGKKYKYIKVKANRTFDSQHGNQRFIQANLLTFRAKMKSTEKQVYAKDKDGKLICLGRFGETELKDTLLETMKSRLTTETPEGYEFKGWEKQETANGTIFVPKFNKIESKPETDTNSKGKGSLAEKLKKRREERKEQREQRRAEKGSHTFSKVDKGVIIGFSIAGAALVISLVTVFGIKHKRKRQED